MAANTTPIFLLTIDTAAVTRVNADSTGTVALVTAGAEGARVLSVTASTDDTAAIDFSLYIQRNGSGTDYLIGSVSVPAGSGNSSSAAAVDLLDPSKIKALDTDGTLVLGSTDVLKVAARTAVTAAKTTYIVATWGNY